MKPPGSTKGNDRQLLPTGRIARSESSPLHAPWTIDALSGEKGGLRAISGGDFLHGLNQSAAFPAAVFLKEVGWSLVAMLQVQQEDTGLFVGITPAVDFSQQAPGTGENANRVIGRFTEGHARMAAVTRFFSESFEKSDTKPPKIHEFNLAGPAQAGEKTVKLSINMIDNKGLGPLVIMRRGEDKLMRL